MVKMEKIYIAKRNGEEKAFRDLIKAFIYLNNGEPLTEEFLKNFSNSEKNSNELELRWCEFI